MRWFLVIGCSKILTFARAINLLAFLEVVCKKDLLLIKLFLFLPISKAERLGFFAGRWAFTDQYLCYWLGNNFRSLEFSFLGRVVFDLTLYRCKVFCFTAAILRYSFFLYSYCLSYNLWATLHSVHFWIFF